MRVAGGFFSDVLLYMAFSFTSYSKAICIFFMNTLLLPPFAMCILNEPIFKVDVFAICVGFVGMLLIVQPFNEVEASSEITKDEAFKLDLIGVSLAFMAAVAGAITVVYVRQVSQTMNGQIIGFYYNVGNLLFCPLWSFIAQRSEYPKYSWGLFGLVVCTAGLYFMMQSLMNYSMRYLTAAMSGSLIYIAIPVSYILDYFFFNQTFGFKKLLGVFLIVFVNVTLGILKGKGIV